MTAHISTKFQRLSKLDHNLTLFVCILLILCPQFEGKSYYSQDNAIEDENQNDICTTSGCYHASERVLNSIDESVDPCDDFYQFSCGNFLNKTVIPEDMRFVHAYTLAGDVVRDKLKTLIEEPIEQNECAPFVQAKIFYQSCMDEAKIETYSLKKLLNVIQELGGWPVLEAEDWNDDEFDWKEFIYKSRKRGYEGNYLIDISIVPDKNNNSIRVLRVNAGKKLLGSQWRKSTIDNYLSYMVDVAVILGANKTLATEELEQALLFESKLSNATKPATNTTTINKYFVIEDLQKMYPAISLMEYINDFINISDVNFSLNDTIKLHKPEYFEALNNILTSDYPESRVIGNYLTLRIIHDSVEFLTKELRDIATEHNIYKEKPRAKYCLTKTTHSLPEVLSAMYVRRHSSEDIKAYTTKILSNIQDEHKKVLEKTEWMDDKTRKLALEKLAYIQKHIAYPSQLLNDTEMVTLYSKLEVEPGDYLQAVLNISRFKKESQFRSFRKPIDRSQWFIDCNVVQANAFYDDDINRIIIPAATLQDTFFDINRPDYMNYGAIGLVFGHELTHGFDDVGSKYDKHGNMVNWWSQSTQDAYKKESECIIQQYNECLIPETGKYINGTQTLGENIADNDGIRQAYFAYKNWVNDNQTEQKLPGLEQYSVEQMFWISAGNLRCGKMLETAADTYLTGSDHSPLKFRVNVALRNNEHFAKDFNCPLGSKMNPVKKCRMF